MKRILAVFAVLFMFPALSVADDLSAMSTEDLLSLRLAVNNELSARSAPVPAPEGASIAELFPDQWIARHIRDELGKFSTNDPVTQEELDTIESLSMYGATKDPAKITTLEGIQYLHGLEWLYVWDQSSITEIPEWIGTLKNLISLEFKRCPISTVPDSICDLTNLKGLCLANTNITALPEDIGNLTSLTRLDISKTKITRLPVSIYALTLDTFNREGLDID